SLGPDVGGAGDDRRGWGGGGGRARRADDTLKAFSGDQAEVVVGRCERTVLDQGGATNQLALNLLRGGEGVRRVLDLGGGETEVGGVPRHRRLVAEAGESLTRGAGLVADPTAVFDLDPHR